ncbi:MAG: type II toxin-antitoxin system HicB family antitoxin [Syntrophomonadaceae bacterium]|nr:type II toxin-antitoxin system HicB family antitoxin [Syntrophomonadaceae bacterium]
MQKDRYIFPAIFDYADDGISIEFPDLPGCLPCADTTEEALKNAQEAMALHLYGMERDGDEIPDPTSVIKLHPQTNQAIVLIEAWMPFYRNVIENHAVKKTLTIPKWLNDLAEEKQVNFSQLLQTSLKKHLGVTDYKPKTKRQA